MKTKIIYISGSEIFDIKDIRFAFNQVKKALNLDSNTVLFGVPVDNENVDFDSPTQETISESEVEQTTNINETNTTEPITADITNNAPVITEPEQIIEKPKKRTRAPKIKEVETPQPQDNQAQENIVPILSVLSSQQSQKDTTSIDETTKVNETEIIETITEPVEDTTTINIEDINEELVEDTINDEESALEALLAGTKPLEVIEEEPAETNNIHNSVQEDDTVDATLERLASEYVENRDKIIAEQKTSGRSRIGKLKNILPFGPTKHKDQGLGDLFGWAGVAANDDEFSIPGFFTKANSKK